MYFHIEICAGSDYEVTFTARDPLTNQPMNLVSGYSLVGKVAKRYFGPDQALYSWSESPNGDDPNVDLLNGSVKVRIPGSASKDWDFRRVFYDIKIVNNVSQKELIVAYGPLTVTPTLS